MNQDEELRRLEERLLHPEVRASSSALDELLADGFLEIGASGRVFDRAQTIAALAAETALPPRRMRDFTTRVLAAGLVLATYRLAAVDEQGGEVVLSLRSSIWQRRGTSWQIIFHQGTPVRV